MISDRSRFLAVSVLLTLLGGGFAQGALAKDSFKVCWSIYVGWMPWEYGDAVGIVDKWARKFDIDIAMVQIDDYSEAVRQYTAGDFDACTMTNMDALTIPAAQGVDSTALIVGDFSNGNDAIVLKGKHRIEEIKGQVVNLVEKSASHYLLARALSMAGLSERDVQLVNTSGAELVAAFASTQGTAAVTWNPYLGEILALPGSRNVFDSSNIPGEIIDLLVVNSATLAAHPELGKALVGAWFEILRKMEGSHKILTHMGLASGTDLEGYRAQLEATRMFYTPREAVAFVSSPDLLRTMAYVAQFSFDHGLLGAGAGDAKFLGIATPAGVFGDPSNIRLRFDVKYMQMAADRDL